MTVIYETPKVGIATFPIHTKMLAILEQKDDLNLEMTNMHLGLISQSRIYSGNEDLIDPV